MTESNSRNPSGTGEPSPNSCVIRAALRGEIGIGDDELIAILRAEPSLKRAKALCLGLKLHKLISRDQAALAFYARLGFAQVGTRQFRVGANDYFDYILSLDL